jgi:Leucine-rich repeat (LRR) protein
MLEELNLDSCHLGDWSIAHLADNNVIPNITSLDLADADISDFGLSKIAQFKQMKRLSLFYCNVTSAGLRHLSSMTKLEVLNLDSREIGDEGLKHLRDLPLQSLDVFSGRVTDLGCAYISRIKTKMT